MRRMDRLRWLARGLVGAAVLCAVRLSGCGSATPATRVLFSPEGGCAQALIREIRAARREIRVAMFAFNREELAAALIEAHKSGVSVQVKFDRMNAADSKNQWRVLKAAGVPVSFHTAPGNLHHKFAVIDGHIVITGSYNWLNRAEELNHENLLFVDDARLAADFLSEWQRVPVTETPP